MRARLQAVAVIVALVATSAGCGDDDPPPPASTGAPAPATTPSTPAFDPPTRFRPTGIALGQARPGDVLLRGTTAFVAGDAGTTVLDAGTGRRLSVLTPKQTPITRDPAAAGHRPVLIDPSGRPTVVVPYAVEIPASGTVASRQAVELLVIDATDGRLTTTVTVDAKPAEGDFSLVAADPVRVVGGRGTAVVLGIGKQVTVVVDVSTGNTLWRDDEFTASALLGDTVVGLTAPDTRYRRSVTGLALLDGAERWSALSVADAELAAAGPSFVVAVGRQNDGRRFYALVKKDGTLANRTTGEYRVGLRCSYDEAAVTVCALGNSEPLFALDSTSGDDLWQLPATGRRAPRMTAAWHGAVYGTVNGAAVVLDARTGLDRSVSPGVAPVAVTAYGGLAADPSDGDTVVFHPAAG
ncbi:PQQ-binding-like beta-propeller repeat protein [Micromonospora maritima]|uniref:outer membrane protein assembly factor BamB family protein n=1 Tax=Micromonospora maritima TaxID=986711 RepID=UPI00157CD9ED|nr:PQQ-binding-like beta-propeller repeat protein [Micromonospora maritima]